MSSARRYRIPARVPTRSVVAHLGGKMSVQPAAPMYVQRTYLDTADWRLHSTGLTLEVDATDRTLELTLRSLDLEEAVAAATVLCRPEWRADLPPEPAWARATAAVGNRRLIPCLSLDTRLQVVAVLDAARKTTARLHLDRYLMEDGNGRRRILRSARVVPVRGYERSADRVAAVLEHAGLHPYDSALLPMALRLMHQPEPGSELGPGVPLDRSMPAARAMGLILARLYQHVVSNQAGVIAQLDTEFLHDFRVAIRRARSVLRRAAGAVDEDRSGRLAEELKWLADLTSPVRDLDVHIEDLESAGRPELRPLADHLREHQAKARACLVKGIQSGRYRRLLGDWEGLTSGPAGQRGAEPAGEFADQRIARAYGRVIDRGAAIDDSSPPEALHDLRKRAKELRYLLECFQTLYPDPARTATVRELKALQDNLGRYQDGQVQAATLRSLAEDLLKSRSAPAATLMAMGGLAEELDQRQTQARADFSQRFNRFASKANRSRMADLVRGD